MGLKTNKCCCPACFLAWDQFEREDSSDPGEIWHIVSGTGNIVDGHIEVDGIVATQVCHPVEFVVGSFIATFDLVNVRSVEYFEVGCGNPLTSPFRVKFTPSGMDTASAEILIEVDNGVDIKSFSQTWPSTGGTSDNIVRVQVCYEPGANLRGSLLIPPSVDHCVEGLDDAKSCFEHDNVKIGGFFFVFGHFDNWGYEATILDNFSCLPCGCFCYKRDATVEPREIEWGCFPELMYVNLEVVDGVCSNLDGVSIPLVSGGLGPGDGHPEKEFWYSDVYECTGGSGGKFAFIAECVTITFSADKWVQMLMLRITDENYIPSTTVFNWEDPDEGTTTKYPNPDLSTCQPLEMVYPGLLVQSQFGPCGPPGSFGYIPFCCELPPGEDCYGSSPVIRLKVSITL